MLSRIGAAVIIATALTVQQTPQFRSGVERILIDVQVIDGDGRPLVDLTAKDFEVRINRQLRRVAAAEFVRVAEVDSAAGGAKERGSDTTAPRSDDPSRGGRDFILAVDEASFRTVDAPAAIRSARRFVQRLAPNDRVGLFTFPVSPRYFELTPDHTAVAMALDRVVGTYEMPRSHFHLSPSEVIDIEGGDTDLVRTIARRECLPQPVYQAECMQAIPGDANLMAESFESQASASIYAMRTLFAALHQDPQRKTVVLLSGGLLSSDRIGGRPNVAGIIDLIGAEAAKADAVVYVLHMDSSFLQAFSASNGGPVSRSLMRESAALGSGLERLAGTAGGALLHAEPGGEDIAFQRILRETSSYYVLAVEPSDEDRDGRLHYISVKANARGAEVRARRTVIIPRQPPA
jgi:VWFA-related protein